ncbi:hypothetical protein [Rhodovulum sp. FJ3]|uniref:hypothetical protein n=1 Tax=Rhodovulum sp. FJ3 TaxID=3079053 RepID=UPI00293DA357|nr:hypothetical protein [Rhodovulum sp. FJ3]MDV4167930.1 hypothetical protein [Rhodovulum sp. FJ3]
MQVEREAMMVKASETDIELAVLRDRTRAADERSQSVLARFDAQLQQLVAQTSSNPSIKETPSKAS